MNKGMDPSIIRISILFSHDSQNNQGSQGRQAGKILPIHLHFFNLTKGIF